MSKFALVDAGLVREVIVVPPGTAMLRDRFHPDVLAKLVTIPPTMVAQVGPGWRWDGSAFIAPLLSPASPTYIQAGVIRERMEAVGKWDEMAALLFALMPTNPGLVFKLLTLTEGVDVNDEQARALIAQAGADPNTILAV